jgi:hypothetical protein
MKELLAGLPLFRAAAKKRKVHEPVGADGRDCDPMFLLQTVDFDDAIIRGQRVSGSTIIIIDAFNVVEAHGLGSRKLFAPGVPGEGLETIVLGRRETSLHDAETHCGLLLVHIFKRWNTRTDS